GEISYPLIGSVAAAGFSPQQLADEISAKLSDYVRNPRTTVTVKDYHTIIVEVLGAVRQPGAYTVQYGARITEVLALAGGTTAEADASHARFTRQPNGGTQEEQVQTLNLQELLAGEDISGNLLLAPGDKLYIPYRKTIDWGKLLTIVSVAEILRRLFTGW
ncbi:MAG: polysaccharide biosynthesis/export family protein, partial [Syntrophothermus sp.]